MFDGLTAGVTYISEWQVILLICFGTLVGLVLGAMPGLTSLDIGIVILLMPFVCVFGRRQGQKV